MFKKIITAITGWFSKELPIVEDAFTKAVGVVNVLKTFLGSATGQMLESILELALPGVGSIIINDLNIFFKDFGILQNIVTGTPAEIAAKGLNAIAALTGNSKITALTNIAAIIGHAASNAKGGNTTIQQALISVPIVYNPDILSVNSPLPAGDQVSAEQLAKEQVELNDPNA